MALPAHIALAVRSHVDARYSFIALGVGSMALAAECARDRFRRPAGQRRDLVLLVGLMAARTRQRGVMRHGLGSGDLAVARAAVLRCMGGFRSMGIVAANTGLQRVVSHRIDLRKAGRAGRIVAVAQRASGALPGGDKMNLRRRLGRERPPLHGTPRKPRRGAVWRRASARFRRGRRRTPGVRRTSGEAGQLRQLPRPGNARADRRSSEPGTAGPARAPRISRPKTIDKRVTCCGIATPVA